MHEGFILCRFVHFAAVLWVFGLGAFRGLLFSSILRAFEASPARRALDRAQCVLIGIALLSAVGWLMLTAATLTDDWRNGLDPTTLMRVLGHTYFGHVWIIHLLLNLMALLCTLHRSPRLLLMLNALLLLTLAPVGHGAMFDGVRGGLLILNQMLHLVGVSLWLGGLLMLAVLLSCALPVDLRKVLLRFSGIGYALVALIIVTGMINVRALSGAIWPDPALSGFGLVLGVKVATVVCMLVLAGVNRRLARAHPLRVSVLRLSVIAEGLFGGIALAAVSLLGTLPPMID